MSRIFKLGEIKSVILQLVEERYFKMKLKLQSQVIGHQPSNSVQVDWLLEENEHAHGQADMKGL